MRTDTQTVSIDTAPNKVADFVSDIQNLPRWAVGFAKAVRKDEKGWLVTTGSGDLRLRIEAHRAAGTVDFWMSPAPGVELPAYSRVVPRGVGSEYIFTQFQAPGMPEEVFEQNVQTLSQELKVLKALLEVECPR
jgi:hypothetical protein